MSGYRKAELSAMVKHLARLAFAWRRWYIVAARRAVVIIEAALEWVHGALRKIFGVTAKCHFPKMAVAYPCRLNIAGMSFSGAAESFCLPINAGCLPLINPVRLGTQVEPDE